MAINYKKRYGVLIGVLIVSMVIGTLITVSKEQPSYRPMVCYNGTLYGETNILRQSLPKGFKNAGQIRYKVSNFEPMKYEDFTSNSVDIGTKVFVRNDNLQSIYLELGGHKYIEYTLIDEKY